MPVRNRYTFSIRRPVRQRTAACVASRFPIVGVHWDVMAVSSSTGAAVAGRISVAEAGLCGHALPRLDVGTVAEALVVRRVHNRLARAVAGFRTPHPPAGATGASDADEEDLAVRRGLHLSPAYRAYANSFRTLVIWGPPAPEADRTSGRASEGGHGDRDAVGRRDPRAGPGAAGESALGAGLAGAGHGVRRWPT